MTFYSGVNALEFARPTGWAVVFTPALVDLHRVAAGVVAGAGLVRQAGPPAAVPRGP